MVVEHYDPEFVRRFGLGDPDYRKGFEPRQPPRPGDGPDRLGGHRLATRRAEVLPAQRQRPDHAPPGGPLRDRAEGGRHPLQRLVRGGRQRRRPGADQPDRRRGRRPRASSGSTPPGNYGGRVYNGPVRVLPDGYLRLRDGSDVAALRFRNRVDENTVTVTLTWNDYRDEEDAGTDKDLDLFVEDWAGRRVGLGREGPGLGRPGRRAGREPQPPRARGPDQPPRQPRGPDRPRLLLPDPGPGQDGAGSRPADRLRVLVTASRDAYIPPGGHGPDEAVEFLDASGEGEIYPPADQPAGPDRRRLRPVLVDRPDGRPPGQARRRPGRLAGLLHRRRGLVRLVERRRLRRRGRRRPEGRRARPAPGHLLRLARECAPLKKTGRHQVPAVRPANHPRPVLRAWKTPTPGQADEIVRG